MSSKRALPPPRCPPTLPYLTPPHPAAAILRGAPLAPPPPRGPGAAISRPAPRCLPQGPQLLVQPRSGTRLPALRHRLRRAGGRRRPAVASAGRWGSARAGAGRSALVMSGAARRAPRGGTCCPHERPQSVPRRLSCARRINLSSCIWVTFHL